MSYGFPIHRRAEVEEDGDEEPEGELLTQMPDTWIQKGEWERVRRQLEEFCG